MLNEKIINGLEEKGFRRWTKNGMDRLYINADALGMDAETYQYRGERVSNSLARQILGSKFYIDVVTEQISAPVFFVKKDMEIMLDDVRESFENDPVTEPVF